MGATEFDIRVVEAGEPDIPAIGTLFWRMWDEAGPGAPGFSGATEEVIAEIAQPAAIAARIGGPERRMFVAYADEDAVAFAATRRVSDEHIELAGIVVLQSMLGRGIGTPVLRAAVERSRELGYRLMTVSTEIDNERAIAFYEARGFHRTGESTTQVEGTDITVTDLALDL